MCSVSRPVRTRSQGLLSTHLSSGDRDAPDKGTFTVRQVLQEGRTRGGSAVAFAAAVLLIAGWLATGPLFGFSNTWQLVVNTGTTIITFLMVFLIQNTQNRDGEAIQMDELLRATVGAHNALLDLEELEETQLDEIRAKYIVLARGAREKLRGGGADTDVAEIDETGLAAAPSNGATAGSPFSP